MKKLILLILISLPVTFTFADDAYTKAMKKNISSLKQASTLEELTEVANAFERIASLKNEEWLPFYYSAYTNVRISNFQKDAAAKDKYLDKAQENLDKAILIRQKDSEITALQGFLLMLRVSVDPANRGQTMAGKVTAVLEKAVQLNPENPRAQFLMGNWAYGTAQFFKSDTSEACNMIKKSLILFENQHGDELQPDWGKNLATGMLQKCEGQ
ncbi:MAG: hypothetical protein M3512_17750 [Bacteroidota bacterium]|nr:hypothetical protein [Bacteroidota bacterium]